MVRSHKGGPWRASFEDLQMALCIALLLGLLVVLFANLAAYASRSTGGPLLPLVLRISSIIDRPAEDRTEQAVALGLALGGRVHWSTSRDSAWIGSSCRKRTT